MTSFAEKQTEVVSLDVADFPEGVGALPSRRQQADRTRWTWRTDSARCSFNLPAPAGILPTPSACPSYRRACCPPHPIRVCVCGLVMEGEEVCLSLSLCAGPRRRGCACLYEDAGGRGYGGGGTGGRVFTRGAAMRRLRSSAWTHPGEVLVVWSSCGVKCFGITFRHRDTRSRSDSYIFRKFADWIKRCLRNWASLTLDTY